MRTQKNLLGFYYRPPNGSCDQVDGLNKSVNQIAEMNRNNPGYTIQLGGDFNTGDVDWDRNTIIKGFKNKAVRQGVIDVLNDHHLSQMQCEPTREGNLLDFYCTNKPGLIKSMTTMLGMSDHNIVVANMDIKTT